MNTVYFYRIIPINTYNSEILFSSELIKDDYIQTLNIAYISLEGKNGSFYSLRGFYKIPTLAQLLDEHSFSKAYQTCLRTGLAPQDDHGLHDAQCSSINFCMNIK